MKHLATLLSHVETFTLDPSYFRPLPLDQSQAYDSISVTPRQSKLFNLTTPRTVRPTSRNVKYHDVVMEDDHVEIDDHETSIIRTLKPLPRSHLVTETNHPFAIASRIPTYPYPFAAHANHSGDVDARVVPRLTQDNDTRVTCSFSDTYQTTGSSSDTDQTCHPHVFPSLGVSVETIQERVENAGRSGHGPQSKHDKHPWVQEIHHHYKVFNQIDMSYNDKSVKNINVANDSSITTTITNNVHPLLSPSPTTPPPASTRARASNPPPPPAPPPPSTEEPMQTPRPPGGTGLSWLQELKDKKPIIESKMRDRAKEAQDNEVVDALREEETQRRLRGMLDKDREKRGKR
ncbi:hypothetical protein TREMEDRAFT_66305 [Tremella mesenterica DSM 1558]|uniref:uncharacterized protein n=1 Tax=Tremella mesenterica (strain ATCC 24925 / CBS 8224 / DSM 1558 / NBRC 9311 / NRRL Y-6157 / RJB 2259-6 / UBC 559-6) TaxID=578456 RepID=UPI00032BD706|nr:uncharacterized protein TREMEDRAFT_66305 [Tremella mesenterica DSM 1558]EIW65708.1 hypothetical protein TREMEDRAFT_66305 [Tremella mesenterica DSM 1558]